MTEQDPFREEGELLRKAIRCDDRELSMQYARSAELGSELTNVPILRHRHRDHLE